MNTKNIIALMLCGTVCTVISASVVAALFYPPGTVTETFRTKIFEILIYILGTVSGFLLGKGNEKDKEPPPP